MKTESVWTTTFPSLWLSVCFCACLSGYRQTVFRTPAGFRHSSISDTVPIHWESVQKWFLEHHRDESTESFFPPHYTFHWPSWSSDSIPLPSLHSPATGKPIVLAPPTDAGGKFFLNQSLTYPVGDTGIRYGTKTRIGFVIHFFHHAKWSNKQQQPLRTTGILSDNKKAGKFSRLFQMQGENLI